MGPETKRIKRLRIQDSIILAVGGRKDVKLLTKAIGDPTHWTLKVTSEQIDIHTTGETTGVHVSRSKIALADKEKTRQLLGLLKPLGKITEAVAIDVQKAGAREALRHRLKVSGRDAELPRMTPDEWMKAYWEWYTEIPVSAFPTANAPFGLLIGGDSTIIGYAWKTDSGCVGILKSDLEAYV